MEQTPKGMRRHVVLRGKTNSGKSTLFNALAGQQAAIVSPLPGTTTDPVSLSMELIPFGPIVLMDTAGSQDNTTLGQQRMQQTKIASRKADAALYVASADNFDAKEYAGFTQEQIPHLLVFSHVETLPKEALNELLRRYPNALVFSPTQPALLTKIQQELSTLLQACTPEAQSIIGGLLPAGSNLILVTPIDAAAPKGRLILPQVQLLRDCLDHGMKCLVCKETELKSALQAFTPVDLVVTDSQVFSYANQQLPKSIPLTSFSMLLAHQKGDFSQFLDGAKALEGLPEHANILLLEGCRHNKTHEDIGRVKLPKMLAKKLGKTFHFHPMSGYDFPDDLSRYQLAIQCGGCMLNQAELNRRLAAMKEANLPVTNYGVALAWDSGILERCCEIFKPRRTE